MPDYPTTPSPTPLFPLGHVVSTPAAMLKMNELGIMPSSLLSRHHRGDWGNVDAHDRRVNGEAVRDGNRIFSQYGEKQDRIWVITEADRCVTTILLPDDY